MKAKVTGEPERWKGFPLTREAAIHIQSTPLWPGSLLPGWNGRHFKFLFLPHLQFAQGQRDQYPVSCQVHGWYPSLGVSEDGGANQSPQVNIAQRLFVYTMFMGTQQPHSFFFNINPFFLFKDLSIYGYCALSIQCSICMHTCRPEEGIRSHYRWL